MGYVEELRRVVGSRPLVLAGAIVFIVDSAGRLLLGWRGDSGEWGIIAGATEPGESLEDTARREASEEAGIEVGTLELLDVISGPAFFKVFPNGDQMYPVSAVFLAHDVHGQIVPDGDETRELRFFALAGLPDGLEPLSAGHQAGSQSASQATGQRERSAAGRGPSPVVPHIRVRVLNLARKATSALQSRLGAAGIQLWLLRMAAEHWRGGTGAMPVPTLRAYADTRTC
jgi:8-oxo-dGTP pyrophosphatase MutT (NUDIX family)